MKKSTIRKSKPLIQINGVYRNFRAGRKEIPALRGVDLEIDKGDFIVILGPSGCGKSTLLNIITGIDKPTDGEVILGGHQFSRMPPIKRSFVRSKNFGIIYQLAWWVKSLDVLGNVALPLYIGGYGEDQANDYAREALKEFHVEDLGGQMPTELSGGEQQLVELARALVTDPPIIVADEPTGNLDSASSDNMMSYFDVLNREHKKTIILVTHNTSYWELGNKRAEMKDGKIVKLSGIDKKSIQYRSR